MISGKAVTGTLHFFNQTLVDWTSKLQPTVETATYGSEFVAARICTDQIIELRNTLRYLGVPVEKSVMFGDNKSVVDSSSLPHGKLTKRHHILAFHRCREAVAAGIMQFHHIDGKVNPADIVSKHWDKPSIWETLRPILFWYGDPGELKGVIAKFLSWMSRRK
jgi:hypothetical protein